MSGNFECYIVRDPRTKEVVYIGEGKTGRHKHVNSGVSNVYGLNKGHFDGIVWDLDIQLFDDKVSADSQETLLIAEHNPLFNVAKTENIERRRLLGQSCRALEDCVATGNYVATTRSTFFHILRSGDMLPNGDIIITAKMFKKVADKDLENLGLVTNTPKDVYCVFQNVFLKSLKYATDFIDSYEKVEGIPRARKFKIKWDAFPKSNFAIHLADRYLQYVGQQHKDGDVTE